MKQPIPGIAGLKPRVAATKPDGKLSKQESHALDAEYRRQRNHSLQLKNHREQMLLAKARGELIERKLVEFQAAYFLLAMHARMLAVPQAYAGRLVGLTDAHEASQILRAAMIECLDELKDLPAKVTDASWLERVAEEQGPAASRLPKPASGDSAKELRQASRRRGRPGRRE
jgi:hypothetical protein